MFLDPGLLVPVGPWWSVLAQAIGIYLLVDFISGILHWSEDRYGSETTPLIGNAIKKNILHHHRPRHITRITLWEAMGTTAFIALGILAVGTLRQKREIRLARSYKKHRNSNWTLGSWNP